MVQPISTQQLFPGVDVSGLDPAELAQVGPTHEKMLRRRRAEQDKMKSLSKRYAGGAERVRGIPDRMAETIGQVVRDPGLLAILESEVYTPSGRYSSFNNNADEYRGNLAPAVQRFLDKTFDDGYVPSRGRRSEYPRHDLPTRFPAFDAIAQAFFGVSVAPDRADEFALHALAKQVSDKWEQPAEEYSVSSPDRQAYIDLLSKNEYTLKALAAGLDAGFLGRKRALEKEPGADDETIARVFEANFVAGYAESMALGPDKWDFHSVGFAGPSMDENAAQYRNEILANYSGRPQAEADRLMGESQNYARRAEEVQEPTLQDAVDSVKAMRPIPGGAIDKRRAVAEAVEAQRRAEGSALDELRAQRMASHENLVFRTKPEPAKERGFLAKLRKTLS